MRAAILAGLLALATAAGAARGPLHVPSPDWRDQVIYFVLTDRFDNGDPGNDDQGAGEFQAGSRGHFNGGDLRGLARRLGYIQGLGATAVWITPPVLNQWVDPAVGYTGYHGYWASDFRRVDPHLGTLADLQGLSRALHGRGMFLVQDIVLNHTGNYFGYEGGWNPADPSAFYVNRGAPTQPPFNLNDPRRAADRQAGVYHWTPAIKDFGDPVQEARFQMSGLDDLNTGNPLVRRALRESYGHWLRAAGVDAFRVDTAFYVPPDFLRDFMQSSDPKAPGMRQVGRATGRHDFFVFGEGFGIDRPFDDTQMRKIERYVRSDDGRPVLPGMLNFPLYGALGDVFARGRPPAELGHRIASMMRVFSQPHRMVNFIDNHDVDRFLAGGSVPAMRQALLAMFTLPGIPVIYYGTEQAFSGVRSAMFAGGWGAGGRDRFDAAAPLYLDIAAMAGLRRTNPLFSRGTPTVLAGDGVGPGTLAWRMDHEGQSALVVFNTADHEALLDNLPTGAPAGSVLLGLYGLNGKPVARVIGTDGRLTLRLPPRSGQVWAFGRGALPAPPPTLAPTLDALSTDVFDGDFTVSGQAPGTARLQLVVDGDLQRAQTVRADATGRWSATVDTSAMSDPDAQHRLTAWSEAKGAGSATRYFHVDRPWRLLADVEDPAGDDHGPGGSYRYPTDPSWGDNRQGDLRRVRVRGNGGALEIELTMHRLTTVWSPPNGFDHVNVTLYLELPGEPGGATVMPLQDARVPAGLRWHRRLRIGGWSNVLTGAETADAANEGTPVSPGATLSTDPATETLRIRLPAAALGRLPSLSGLKLYVTTWDYDGVYRALTPEPAPYGFGGGPRDGAKVMDDSPVIALP
jgi:glycosidase